MIAIIIFIFAYGSVFICVIAITAECFGNKGTWSNKLLVCAALASLVEVGWSGTIAREMSRWFFNMRLTLFGYHRVSGLEQPTYPVYHSTAT